MYRKLLKSLCILQVVSNHKREPKLGKGYSEAMRFNPFNPLSYIALVLILIIGIILYGVIGFWNETDVCNPFKWN